ncbi:MAG: HAD hydrolase-like protein [Verrucomicrobia subdivision 3 bacterium]|nr:HAD hydrolase-like protein [Limisphaerales bacterium]
MPSVRLVLFDIDGTLIHSGGAGEKAFAHVCRTIFKTPNGTKNLHFAGRTDTAIVRDFLTRHDIPPSPANFQTFFDHYVFWLDHMLAELSGRVLPGVERCLAELSALPEPPAIGLLTGNIRLGAQIKLSHYGLWHHFQTGGFGDDSEDRCQIAVIARERGDKLLNRRLAGDEILVIGDTPLDIECARAIGARVLAVGTGMYKMDDLRRHKPECCVESLEDVRVADLYN